MADLALTFESLNDVEHEETGTRSCTLKYAMPNGPAKGLALVVPGFGADVDDDYNTMLRRYISNKYGLVAVTVDYHCLHSRPPAARVNIDSADYPSLVGQVVMAGRPDLVDISNSTKTLDNALKNNVKIGVRAKIIPPNGDNQNFGVLQSIDHINAVYALQDAGVEFDASNIVAIGTSHGGYIAHMIMKLAPNLLSGIIDNSAYTECSPNFVGAIFECRQSENNVSLFLNTQTKWRLSSPNMPGYFGPAQFAIRDLSLADHLQAIRDKSEHACQIRMLNSGEDGISPIAKKERQARRLKDAGFDVTFDRIESSDIDGKVLKTLDHGMDAAINALFDRYYPTLSPGNIKTDRDLNTDIAFDCMHTRYRFEHKAGQGRIQFTVEEID